MRQLKPAAEAIIVAIVCAVGFAGALILLALVLK